MPRIRAFLAPILPILPVLIVALSACAGGAGAPEDAADFDAVLPNEGGSNSDAAVMGNDASAPCAMGQWVCRASGAASRCDGRGGLSQPVDCAIDGQVCVPDLGCRLCAPGSGRCDPMHPEQTATCSADGMSWVPGASCNTSAGEVCDTGVCRLPCNAADGDACEFWSTATPDSQLDPRFPFGLVLSNAHGYPVTVTVSGGGLSTAVVQSVMPHASAALALPWVGELSQNRPECFANGATPLDASCVARSMLALAAAYHVESNGPVTVAQFPSLEYRDNAGVALGSDASLLLPVQALGARYVIPARGNQTRTITDAQGQVVGSVTLGGFFSVVGTDPDPSGTRVTVVLSAAARDPMSPTSVVRAGTHSYTLRRGDVLQFVGSAMGEDLTGSTVDASHSVAVFVGHDCAQVPDGRERCNHLEEQLTPVDSWGRQFVVSQPRDRGTMERYRVRVVSAVQSNQLSFDGIETPPECASALDVGRWCEFETAHSFQVTGSGPMQVVQYALSLGDVAQCDTTSGVEPADRPECAGSAAMGLVQPVESFRGAYDIAVPEAFDLDVLNVTAPDGASFTLDGMPLDASNASAAGTGYRVIYAVLFPGTHHVACDDATQAFGLQVYGNAPWTEFMYPGGLGYGGARR